jgi:hypothetical protein
MPDDCRTGFGSPADGIDDALDIVRHELRS